MIFELTNNLTHHNSSVSVFKQRDLPSTPPSPAIRTTPPPTAYSQPAPPPPPLPPPAPDHSPTPCRPPGGTTVITPHLATSLDAIPATVEAAFERAVPELAHEWPHAVREAAQAAAAMCQGLLATGGAAQAASTIRGYNVAAASDPRPATMVARRLRSKLDRRYRSALRNRSCALGMLMSPGRWSCDSCRSPSLRIRDGALCGLPPSTSPCQTTHTRWHGRTVGRANGQS